MTKPKYCSWDVSDLGVDHGWSVESDERDITNVRLSKKCGGTIYASVHLQTGFTQVHFEKTDQEERSLIYSARCIEFSELEEVLSTTKFFNPNNTLESSLNKPVPVSGENSQIKGNCESKDRKVVCDGGDKFDEIQNLIRSWDVAEKV